MVYSSNAVLLFISAALGWLYLACWSISCYPQVVFNCSKKSVTGLSVDYVIASFYGFLFYAIFTSCFYFSQAVQDAYMIKHMGNSNLVSLHDVLFALHSTVLTSILLIQIALYKKTNEGPSVVGLITSILLTVVLVGGSLLAYWDRIDFLDFLYILSYFKIALTIVKYIPQVWMNYTRRSTVGWSISNVLLDFFGGTFSVLQLIIDALLSGYWAGILGFATKLAIGVISICFDIIFLTQHYIWFPPVNELVPL